MLLFRDQAMDDDTQIAFSENFGPLETTRQRPIPPPAPSSQRQSNLDIMTGEPIPPDDMRMIYQKANYFWHSDSSFKRIPSLCSILDGADLPARGRQHRVPEHARGLGCAAAGPAGDDPSAGRRTCAGPLTRPRPEGHPERQVAVGAAAGQAAHVPRQSRSTAAARSISAPMPAASSTGQSRSSKAILWELALARGAAGIHDVPRLARGRRHRLGQSCRPASRHLLRCRPSTSA